MGRSHKNDKRRLTARERAMAFSDWCFENRSASSPDYIARLTKLLSEHARATLARYKAKVRRG